MTGHLSRERASRKLLPQPRLRVIAERKGNKRKPGGELVLHRRDEKRRGRREEEREGRGEGRSGEGRWADD